MVQDFGLITFIVFGINRISVDMAAILLDAPKENHLLLTHTNETNTKAVIRSDQHVNIIDNDIVVGDMLSVNYHSLVSIPADCVVVGPSIISGRLEMDKLSLPGESALFSKNPGDAVFGWIFYGLRFLKTTS